MKLSMIEGVIIDCNISNIYSAAPYIIQGMAQGYVLYIVLPIVSFNSILAYIIYIQGFSQDFDE